jgi:hypothetical protein
MSYICRPNPNEKHKLTTYKHGHANNGKKTKIYRLWCSINERCNNSKCASYPFYGAKGVKVCDRWKDFTTFKKDVEVRGYKEGYSILRIRKDKDYEPKNIKISPSKGTAKLHSYKGNHLTLAQLLKLATNGIQLRGLQKRLITGKTVEYALHHPVRQNKPKALTQSIKKDIE